MLLSTDNSIYKLTEVHNKQIREFYSQKLKKKKTPSLFQEDAFVDTEVRQKL